MYCTHKQTENYSIIFQRAVERGAGSVANSQYSFRISVRAFKNSFFFQGVTYSQDNRFISLMIFRRPKINLERFRLTQLA